MLFAAAQPVHALDAISVRSDAPAIDLTGVLEFIGFAPKGTQAVHTMLLKAAVNLEKGGDLGIFSPMYLIVMKKPLAA